MDVGYSQDLLKVMPSINDLLATDTCTPRGGGHGRQVRMIETAPQRRGKRPALSLNDQLSGGAVHRML